MLEIEILVDPALVGELATRIMTVQSDREVTTDHTSVLFDVDIDERLDETLQGIEEALQVFERLRSLDPLEVRARKCHGPDSCTEAIECGRFLICRPHGTIQAKPGQILLTVEAEMAFGTGAHPSTMLALWALQEYFSPKPGRSSRTGSRVLDVGTGSGILALAAARLGDGPILAVDPSPLAMAAAETNVALNALSDRIELSPTAADQVSGEFDLIVANLVPGVFVKAGKKLARLLPPDGAMIVAGFADSQTPQVLKSVAKTGLVPEKSYCRDGWSALLLSRPVLT